MCKNTEAFSKCCPRCLMHALGKITISIKRRYHWSSSCECIEQSPSLLQVRGIKPLGEPAIDRCQQLARLGTLAMALPQTRQAHDGAQLQRLGLQLPHHVEGALKTRLGFVLLPPVLSWVALGCAQK